jgi:Lactoylglutathione lyase and related lyases
MQFNGFHHIGLFVKNVEESLKFYTEGLGGKTTFSFPMGNSGKTIFLVDLGNNAVVELIPRGNENPEVDAKWAHIAVAADDARAAYALAMKAGAKSQSEPNDMMLGTMAVCNAFVNGPDGEVIEFFQVK